MDENIPSIKRAIFSQCLGVTPLIEISVLFEGCKYKIQGRVAPAVQGPTVIVLLKNGSKGHMNQEALLGDDAESRFSAAARQLLEKGKNFYTALRPEWDDSPFFIWTKALN